MKLRAVVTAVILTLDFSSPIIAATIPTGTLPQNGTIILGSPSVAVSGSTMTVTSTTGLPAAITWGSAGQGSINPGSVGGFNIGSGATVNFEGFGPILNIDTTGSASQIDGKITSSLNSNEYTSVYIANENGIFVGNNAVINAGENLGLIASGLNTSATALSGEISTLEGELQTRFTADREIPSFLSGGGMISVGTGAQIISHDGGIILAGSSIVNDGSISTPNLIALNFTGQNSSLDIGSSGSISGGGVYIDGTDDANQTVSMTINGGLTGTNTIIAKHIGIQDITGSGSITVQQLYLNNVVGYINNNTTGEILANGFRVNIENSSLGGSISFQANGASPQGINLKVNGSVAISAEDTPVTVNGQSPANGGSRLVIQDEGTLTVSNDRDPGGFFYTVPENYNPYNLKNKALTFPGLVYLSATNSIQDANDDIVNAYTTSAPVGFGVFLISPTINDSNPVYAIGNRGVAFAGLFNGSYYGYSMVNGFNNPNQGMPNVYFYTNSGINQNKTFTNGSGVTQEMQTFYTFQ